MEKAIKESDVIAVICEDCYADCPGTCAEVEKIKALTAVQPERKNGEWSDGYRWQRCSLCKQTGKKSWNYCPNCGAKMTTSTK